MAMNHQLLDSLPHDASQFSSVMLLVFHFESFFRSMRQLVIKKRYQLNYAMNYLSHVVEFKDILFK